MGKHDELIRMTASEAVSRLKAGDLEPVDLIEAAAARIDAVEPSVNALPYRFLDQARERAKAFRESTKRHPAREHPGWLAGLPIAVKDYNDVAGQPTTYGSPLFAKSVAERSDATVVRLESRGAIPIAKSNVPEFAGANTFNRVYGATLNPWDRSRTCGGSSGGSAVALATGEVWLATGNDLGGSLRIPASYCGIVGLRPSVGRVPRPASLLPFDALWVEGPMGRTVADVALMLDAQVGTTPADPLTFPAPAVPFAEVVRNAKPPKRVGFAPDLGQGRAVDNEVVALCQSATERFTEMRISVEPACPDLADGIDCFQVLRAQLFAALRGDLLEQHRDEIAPEIVWNIEKGLKVTAEEIQRAERQRQRVYHSVVSWFEDYDLLACPTVALPPFPVEQRYPTEINGEPLTTYIDWMFLTFVLTLTGCPAISLPCGFTESGLPVGLQLMGPPAGDAAVLGAAQLLEEALDLARLVPLEPRVARSQALGVDL
jgi:amidase